MSKKPSRWLLVFVAAAALSACATGGPPKPAGTGSAPTGNYRRVVRNGQTLYCQRDTPTGTRMMQETCLTQAEMDAQEEKARSFTQGVQGIAMPPPSSPNVR
jgi:hypothetical protein